MTTTTGRKQTPPRKAATARVNGQANGPPQAPAAVDDLHAPERFEPTTTPKPPAPAPKPPAIEHPYGDISVFVFRPKVVKPGDSMDPIVFPHITTLNADVEFFWELDDMDPMHQSFRYMRRANIPREIQRRAVRLPEDELARLLTEWFMGITTPQGVGPPGES